VLVSSHRRREADQTKGGQVKEPPERFGTALVNPQRRVANTAGKRIVH
jgi:hypothetical protein